MYKHQNQSNNTIGVIDDLGIRHAWQPNQIITLNRVYIELEPYRIKCLNPTEQKPVLSKELHTKKQNKKIQIKESD